MLGKDGVHVCMMLATLTFRRVRSGSENPRVGRRVVMAPFLCFSTRYEGPGDQVRMFLSVQSCRLRRYLSNGPLVAG